MKRLIIPLLCLIVLAGLVALIPATAALAQESTTDTTRYCDEHGNCGILYPPRPPDTMPPAPPPQAPPTTAPAPPPVVPPPPVLQPDTSLFSAILSLLANILKLFWF